MTSTPNDKNQAYKDLLYYLSHDLSAPIRHIKFFSGLLGKDHIGKEDEKGLGYIEIIEDAAVRMETMLEGLLNISRIYTGAITQHGTLRDVLEGAKNQAEGLRPEKKIALELDLQEVGDINLPDKVFTRFFLEILKNSALFNTNEEAVVRIRAVEETPTHQRFEYSDNSLGVAHLKDPSKVFTFFWRGFAESEYPGVGLGLSYCKAVMEYFGGHMEVQIRDNVSVWLISLPKAWPKETTPN